MENQPKIIQSYITITADKYGDPIDMLLFDSFTVYWGVPNGSASSGDNIKLFILAAPEEDAPIAEWVQLTPDDGTQFTTVDGTGGTNPWPKFYVKKFSTFARWIMAHLDVTGTAAWSTKVTGMARG